MQGGGRARGASQPATAAGQDMSQAGQLPYHASRALLPCGLPSHTALSLFCRGTRGRAAELAGGVMGCL